MSTRAPPTRISSGTTAYHSIGGVRNVAACARTWSTVSLPVPLAWLGSVKLGTWSSMCAISLSTEGSMRSSIGFGYTPRKTISPTSGSIVTHSRMFMSFIDALASSGSPWKTRW